MTFTLSSEFDWENISVAETNEELVVNVQEGPTFRFHSWEKLQEWIAKERDAWSWIINSGNENIGGVISHTRTGLDRLENFLRQTRDAGHSPIAAKSEIENTFSISMADALFHSESLVGERILGIHEEVGEDAAIYALAFARRRVGLAEASTRHRLRAVMMLSAPEITSVSALKDRLTSERTNYRNMVHRLNDAVDAAERERISASLANAQKFRRLAWMWMRRGLRNASAKFDAWEGTQRQSINDIKGVENTYRTAMGLQAPVEYWNNKADNHKIAEKAARGRLLLFFPLAGAFLAAIFGVCGWGLLSIKTDPIPTALYFIVSAGLASIAGMAFWAGRLLSKLYLSEHHLRHDAEERAVMTMTYLALTHEKAAEDTDRQIVLAALFRSTPDGIVKDDGPPELGIPSLIGKVMGR